LRLRLPAPGRFGLLLGEKLVTFFARLGAFSFEVADHPLSFRAIVRMFD
jgi:hypothetical protein